MYDIDTLCSETGDTADSYAYDGNRLRKWNKTTSPYGETWQVDTLVI